jgi:hypothetical protein
VTPSWPQRLPWAGAVSAGRRDLVRDPQEILTALGFRGAAGILSRLGVRAAPEAPNSAFGLIFVGCSSGAFAGSLIAAGLGLSPLAGLAILAYRSRVAVSFD